MYTQILYGFEGVPAVVKAKPEPANVESFKTVLSGDREAIAKLSTNDLAKILAATLTGMSVEDFSGSETSSASSAEAGLSAASPRRTERASWNRKSGVERS